MFSILTVALANITYNPAMNGIYEGAPRGAPKQVRDANGNYSWSLGDKLDGTALTNAQAELDKHLAYIFWFGDVELAVKYGQTFPEAGLTPVENERWNRTVSACTALVSRLTEVVTEAMGAPPEEPVIDAGNERKVDVGTEAKVAGKTDVKTEAKVDAKLHVATPASRKHPNSDILAALVNGLDAKGKAELLAMLTPAS